MGEPEVKHPPRTFKAEDIDNPALLNKLLEDIANDPSIVDTLPEDEMLRIQKLISPYGTVPESVGADRWTCLSFVNLRQEYMKKLLITALVGYLYRRCDEYARQFKDTVENMDDMAAAEQQVIANQKRVKELEKEIVDALRERNRLEALVEQDTKEEAENKNLYDVRKCEMTKEKILELRDFASALHANQDLLRLKNKEILRLEEELDAIQGFGKRFIIRQFLDDQFRFNPDKHVRSSYVNTSANRTASAGAAYVDKFTPPDDTLHNFQYYLDSNYEEIRGVTERIYRVRPDLEVAILPYADFPSEQEADGFVSRNKDSVIADIRTLKYGKWNLIEAFKANRDRIEAYRGTIVEDILQQIKDDTKVGAELVRDKATRRARSTLKEFGPAPKAMTEYMSQHAPDNMANVVNMEETKEEEAKRIYEEHQRQKREYECALLKSAENEETPHDALRVNIYTMRKGGQTTDTSHMYTKAKAPETQQMMPQQQQVAAQAGSSATSSPPQNSLPQNSSSHETKASQESASASLDADRSSSSQ
jgi:hypothetical protein